MPRLSPHRLGRLAVSIALAVVVAPDPRAQAVESPELPAAASANFPPSVGASDFVRYGRDYVAKFGADSVEFVPITRDRRPRKGWRYRLTSIERTSERSNRPLPLPTLWRAANRVSYVRPGVEERYDVLRRGMKQSFVFDALPRGTGDLVVRGRVTTELVADVQGLAAQELRFGASDGSGVQLGAVLGIDASGRTARGLMRYADGHLEFVLPAAFVDAADLPLELDPLVGAIHSPSAPWAEEFDPDVAYDETNDVFLLVFARDDPALPLKVGGQFLRPDGTAAGAPFEISDGELPQVGNVSARDAFLIAYVRDGGLHVRSVHAATGAISAETTVIATGSYVSPVYDVGDNSSSTGDQVPVLWGVGGTGRGRSVQIPSSGPPLLGAASFSLARSEVVVTARVTEVGAMPGHYLIAYDEWSSYFGTPRQVWVDLVDLSGSVIQRISTGWPSASKESVPAIAGEGMDYLLVYEKGETAKVLLGRDLTVVSGGIVLGPEIELVPTLDLTARPSSLVRLRNSYLLGFDSLGRSRAISLDPSQCCTPCEGEFSLSLGAGSGLGVAVARRTRNGQAADEAMLAWARSGSRRWIETSAFRAEDGVVTDLGGGCAPGGEALVSCARAGNAGFTHELRSAAPNAQVLLVLGAGSASFPCGPCTLVLDLALPAVVAFSGTTDARGHASTATPLPALPALVGAVLVEQWAVVASGGCPLLGMALSNGLAVEIQ